MRPIVFCIGANKSGTKTLARFASTLGYRPKHNIKWDTLAPYIEDRFDFFSDINILGTGGFKQLDINWPGSKFILQVRGLRDWVISRHSHRERKKIEVAGGKRESAVTANEKHHVAAWIVSRELYHREVFSYFAGREKDLLTVDVTADRAAQDKLESFLCMRGPSSNSLTIEGKAPTDHILRSARVVDPWLSEWGFDDSQTSSASVTNERIFEFAQAALLTAR